MILSVLSVQFSSVHVTSAEHRLSFKNVCHYNWLVTSTVQLELQVVQVYYLIKLRNACRSLIRVIVLWHDTGQINKIILKHEIEVKARLIWLGLVFLTLVITYQCIYTLSDFLQLTQASLNTSNQICYPKFQKYLTEKTTSVETLSNTKHYVKIENPL